MYVLYLSVFTLFSVLVCSGLMKMFHTWLSTFLRVNLSASFVAKYLVCDDFYSFTFLWSVDLRFNKTASCSFLFLAH